MTTPAEYEAEIGRLRKLATEMLCTFTQEWHPGEPCLRSELIPVATVEKWRAALSTPHGESQVERDHRACEAIRSNPQLIHQIGYAHEPQMFAIRLDSGFLGYFTDFASAILALEQKESRNG